MSFPDAVMTCLDKFLIFQGRATRAEFWWFFLAWVVAGVIAAVLELLLETKMISIGVQVVFLLPTLAVGARRLHDTNRPGYYLAIPLVSLPLLLIGREAWGLGMLFALAVLIMLLCLPSQTGPNAYGPDPRVEPDLEAFE